MNLREKCGVVGVLSKDKGDVSEVLFLALFSLQHRGQEAAGAVLLSKDGYKVHKDFGLVKEVFKREFLEKLKGYLGIAHTRYSTFGESKNYQNIQPLYFTYKGDFLAVAHNGTLTNYHELRGSLEEKGVIFHTTTDSEIFLYMYVHSAGSSIEEKVAEIFSKVKGAYSVVMLVNDRIVFFKDPWGFRPLVYGENKHYFMIASETSALRQAGITNFRELEPGEVGIYGENGLTLKKLPLKSSKREQCVFELIYFSRPDSITFGHNVYTFRKLCGIELAKLENRDIDVVVPVPDSGVPASIGYARELSKPLEFGLMRSHFAGRSFIEPTDREKKVKMKLIPVREVIEGKKIALIDDSLVRGTTSKEIVRLLRHFGAKEVHLRFASPPIVAPCFFGIDIPTKEELLASTKTLEELRSFLEADSVMYLPIAKVREILGKDWRDFCFSCFTGIYNPDCVEEKVLKAFENYRPPILDEIG